MIWLQRTTRARLLRRAMSSTSGQYSDARLFISSELLTKRTLPPSTSMPTAFQTSTM